MEKQTLKRSLLAVALLSAIGAGYARFGAEAMRPGEAIAAVAAAPATPPRSAMTLPDFTSIVEQSGPAVVNISVSGVSKTVSAIDPDDPMFEFFRRFGMPAPRDPAPARGQGSGFIVGADGLILTNAHVVADADEVTVKLTDKREFRAKVVGLDKLTDVAVLRIETRDLPVLRLGDPARTRVGEWVVAIGSPFGFENSVTAGIVSAKSRTLAGDSYVPFLQTDVPVNPGNSGGPLFNADGEVVGINSQIYSRSGGYMGLAFAIPIDVAMDVVNQLKANGKVSRGYLGVVVQDIDRNLAEAYGLSKPAGALVAKVLPETPAEKAGIKEGDVITAFDGHDIGQSSELPQMIGRAKVGKKYPLAVLRDGKAQTLSFEVANLPEDDDISGNGEPDIDSLQISIRNLTDPEKAQLKLDSGVLVQQVADGAAAEAGVRPGDVIVKLNNQAVKDTQEFVRIAKKLPADKAVPMTINRRGQPMILALKLESKEKTEKDKKKKSAPAVQ